jgi:hypothetical protein
MEAIAHFRGVPTKRTTDASMEKENAFSEIVEDRSAALSPSRFHLAVFVSIAALAPMAAACASSTDDKGGGKGTTTESRFCRALNKAGLDGGEEFDSATLKSLLGDAAASCVISASNYDLSCTKDSDCVPAALEDTCQPWCTVQCPFQAINARDLPKYQADVARTPLASCGPIGVCSCPCQGSPKCEHGQCTGNCN